MSGYFTSYPIIVPMIHEYASFDSIRQFDTMREDTFLCYSDAWSLYNYLNKSKHRFLSGIPKTFI